MLVQVQTDWVLTLILISCRWFGVLLFTPVLGFSSIPTQVRVMFVLALAAVTVGAVAHATQLPAMPTTVDVTFAVFGELLLGAALGFGVLCAFGAFMVGGRVLDFQMGFGIATLFDPTSKEQASLMGTLLTMLGAVIFLAVDAHHTLIRAIVYSFETVPIGAWQMPDGATLVAQFGLMFAYGMILVSPAVLGLMLIDVAIAVGARLMPQVNIYFVSLPLKVIAGLALAAASLRYLEPVVLGMFEGIFHYWQQILVRT